MHDIDTSHEEWKPIADWPEYEVSSLGRVRRVAPHPVHQHLTKIGRVLRYGFSRTYPTVTLCARGNLKTYSVHRLVALAFHGTPSDPNLQVNHIDANPRNPKASNLEWVTQSQNRRHAVKLGNVDLRGEKNNQARLDARTVQAIRKMAETSKQAAVAAHFGISQGHVSAIVNRRLWAHA